jgi:hypothetical protein
VKLLNANENPVLTLVVTGLAVSSVTPVLLKEIKLKLRSNPILSLGAYNIPGLIPNPNLLILWMSVLSFPSIKVVPEVLKPKLACPYKYTFSPISLKYLTAGANPTWLVLL